MSKNCFCAQDYVLNSGIRRQLDAFRSGFNAVFPMDKLGSFSPEEVLILIFPSI